MDRKGLKLIFEENLLEILKKNADQQDTSVEKYIEKILKEFINAK
jgi:predicted HicB family RNase H-like nuclease